jgi:hypothetical protein
LAKLFGNEKNFQLIKSLMGDTSTQRSSVMPATEAGPKISISKQRTNQLTDDTINDKEVKVEKAILDLNELKN